MRSRSFPLRILGFALGAVIPAAADDSADLYVTYVQSPTAIQAFQTAEDYRGATIAIEKINEEGGLLGRIIRMVDGRSGTLEQIKALAIEQAERNEIFAAVGPNTSSAASIVAPLFQAKGIPMVATIATDPAVTSLGDFIFRACFIDPFQGELMANFALDDLKARTAVILIKATDKYSVSLSDYFRSSFSRRGKVAWEGKYMGDSSDFSDILAPIQSLNPDVVFLPGHGSDSGLIVKQARSMGIKTVFLGGDGWGKGMLGIAGAVAAEGSYFANHWHVDVANPGNAEFLTRYRRLYGEGSVAASAALAYDAVNLVAAAVRKAGSFDRKAIRDALAGTSKFQGITGSITLNAQRDPVGKSGVVMQYRNGEIRFVKSVSPR